MSRSAVVLLAILNIQSVVHCAWVRDETWPAGAVAPDPDDIAEEMAPS